MRDLLEALCGVNVREIPFKTTEGMESLLSDFEVETVLVVNVASRCGLAPQYETLEKLQQRYGERGLQVVGFPSNQFLQELRSEWQGGKGSVELREVPPDDQRRGAPFPSSDCAGRHSGDRSDRGESAVLKAASPSQRSRATAFDIRTIGGGE